MDGVYIYSNGITSVFRSQIRFNLVSVLRVILFVLLKSKVGSTVSYHITYHSYHIVFAKRHAQLEKVYETNSLSWISHIMRIDSVHQYTILDRIVTRFVDSKTNDQTIKTDLWMVKRQNDRSQSVLKLFHKNHNGKNLKMLCNLSSQYYTENSSVQFYRTRPVSGKPKYIHAFYRELPI